MIPRFTLPKKKCCKIFSLFQKKGRKCGTASVPCLGQNKRSGNNKSFASRPPFLPHSLQMKQGRARKELGLFSFRPRERDIGRREVGTCQKSCSKFQSSLHFNPHFRFSALGWSLAEEEKLLTGLLTYSQRFNCKLALLDNIRVQIENGKQRRKKSRREVTARDWVKYGRPVRALARNWTRQTPMLL